MAKKPNVFINRKIGSVDHLREILQTLPKEDGTGPLAGFNGKEFGKSLFLAAGDSGSPCYLLYRLDQRQEKVRGISIKTDRLIVEEREQEDTNRVLFVRAGRDADETAFLTVIHSVIDDYLAPEKEGVDDFISAVRKFILASSSSQFTQDRQVGLMGELAVLEHDLIHTLATPLRQALAYWLGPFGAAKDFDFPSCCLEVKATKKREDQSFWVSSEEQFLIREDKPMFLCFVTFEKDDSGETVAKAVERVGKLFQPNREAFNSFVDAVSAAGLKIEDVNSYENLESLRLVGREYFRVDATFPRLRLEDLKKLLRCHYVSEIKYTIAVDHLQDLKEEREVVLAAIKAREEGSY